MTDKRERGLPNGTYFFESARIMKVKVRHTYSHGLKVHRS